MDKQRENDLTEQNKLPRQPSELLDTSVRDFRRLDRTKYRPTYHAFHEPHLGMEDNICHV